MFYTWLLVVILLTIIELSTTNLVSIWFVVSGVIAMFSSFVADSVLVQFAIFVILGIVFMLLTKPLIKRWKQQSFDKTNVDRIIGMRGRVTEAINPGEIGEVKVDGKKWSAYSDDKDVISVNTDVRIEKINSVKLKVTPWKE